MPQYGTWYPYTGSEMPAPGVMFPPVAAFTLSPDLKEEAGLG